MSYSLWLVPHENNPFTKALREFIEDEVPRQFDKKQSFFPHVTVTNNIDLGGKSPQEYVDNLSLPSFKAESNEVHIYLDEIDASDDKWKKMHISVSENANLTKLAEACGAGKDWEPHLSLLYADLDTKEVANKKALIEMKLQFAVGDIFACCGGSLCLGGFMWVVDTSKPVEEWKAEGKRETDWVMWRATRNLL